MVLYIAQGRGRGSSTKIWESGDCGQPNRADSKEELIAFCPEPDPAPCPAAGCDGLRYVMPKREPRAERADHGRWQWLRMGLCLRCQHLRGGHGLTLAELVAMWESQDRQCINCRRTLPDPRIITSVRGGGRDAHIDHDHRICPKQGHSCEKCRRGLVCVSCNTHPLALRTVGLWVLPEEAEKLARWLEFIGPEERDRLRAGLALFPDQSARKVSRRRSRGVDAVVVPLFDLNAS